MVGGSLPHLGLDAHEDARVAYRTHGSPEDGYITLPPAPEVVDSETAPDATASRFDRSPHVPAPHYSDRLLPILELGSGDKALELDHNV